MTIVSVCPACAGKNLRAVAATVALPVTSNVYPRSAEAARGVTRASLELWGCEDCGLLFNRAFDPRKLVYDAAYETSLHHSQSFRDYAAGLVAALQRSLPVRGATILEIGCGRGEFLALLQASDRRCIGFDRSYDGTLSGTTGLDLRARDFDPTRDPERGDLVICRHVLEHLSDPLPLAAVLRAATTPEGQVYVEVPSGEWTLRDGGVWDLIYEHCSYFTPRALEALLLRAGLVPQTIETAFGGQFLRALCGQGAASSWHTPAPDAHLFGDFAARLASVLRDWSRRMQEASARGLRVAAWGAGSKAVTFLNAIEGADRIVCVVDQNPRKQGLHIAGTGCRIVAPKSLVRERPDLLLVMNPRYRDEIAATMRDLGLERVPLDCVS
ncbi:MAG: class I SAM-dependent methyltransferase [Planctomycetota bacterium]